MVPPILIRLQQFERSNIMRHAISFPAALLACGFALTPALAAQQAAGLKFTYQYIPLPAGATNISATGIDAAGDVVGSYVDAGSIKHTYLYSQGKLTDLLPANSAFTYTQAPSISPNGLIAATGFVSGSDFYGFELHAGKVTTIQAPGKATPMTTVSGIARSGAVAAVDGNTGTVYLAAGKKFTAVYQPPAGTPAPTVTGMNSLNTIIGNYAPAGGVPTVNGFMSLHGAPAVALQLPNSFFGVTLKGLNNNDVAVGSVSSQTMTQGLIYKNGAATLVTYPHAPETVLLGINDVNTVIGYAVDKNSNVIPFVLPAKGAFTPLSLPGSITLTYPTAINRAGVVTGITLDFDTFTSQIFIATPVK